MATDRASLSKVVSEKIRSQILAGKLRPGERLVEDRLSAELGVSRVPVREALRGLSMEGLVRLEPNRGASVTSVTPGLLAELVEVRTLLEALNARLAARRHDPAIVEALQDTLRRGNAAAQSGTADELARLNAEFHERLAEASRNSVLSDIMRSLRERTSLAFAINGRARAREDWKEHAGILAAVIEGDEEIAALLAARHVKNAAAAFARMQAGTRRKGSTAPPTEGWCPEGCPRRDSQRTSIDLMAARVSFIRSGGGYSHGRTSTFRSQRKGARSRPPPRAPRKAIYRRYRRACAGSLRGP